MAKRVHGWLVAYWVLFCAFLGTAALNMLHVRGGFFTNYAADIVVPAWLYISWRGLPWSPHLKPRYPWLGATPERTAALVFGASTLTELCQRYWPRGFFPGHYDPLDIAAFAAGVGVCYVFDRLGRARTN